MFIYFWERERVREAGSKAEREGDTKSKAGSRLWAVSTEPNAGLELMSREIMTWVEGRVVNRLSHPGAPEFTVLDKCSVLAFSPCPFLPTPCPQWKSSQRSLWPGVFRSSLHPLIVSIHCLETTLLSQLCLGSHGHWISLEASTAPNGILPRLCL